MDLKNLKSKILTVTKRYRYFFLILLLGLAFMLIPDQLNRKKNVETDTTNTPQTVQSSVDTQLSEILSQIDGAGKVKVMLTLAEGEQTLYQTDSNTTQVNTVIITDADRAQEGLVKQINPPIYLGAIVVCEGADSPAIRLAIVEAVSKVTGLGADRISVLKMK